LARTLRQLWGNGKAAHGDPNAQILFFGSTKGAFAGFGLDGATIKWDESGDKALYGKPIANTVIVNGGTPMPVIAEAFVSKLGQGSNRSLDLNNQALLALAFIL
jgi:lipid-binding SYLF domain-containing protein